MCVHESVSFFILLADASEVPAEGSRQASIAAIKTVVVGRRTWLEFYSNFKSTKLFGQPNKGMVYLMGLTTSNFTLGNRQEGIDLTQL